MPASTPVRPEFPRWLQHRRLSVGLTQRELADRLGVGERSVRAWESGESTPSLRAVRLIGDSLGVRPAMLLVADGPPQDRAAMPYPRGR